MHNSHFFALSDKAPEEELDDLSDILEYSPRDWEPQDLWLFQLDVRTFASNTPRWREALEPSATPAPGIA